MIRTHARRTALVLTRSLQQSRQMAGLCIGRCCSLPSDGDSKMAQLQQGAAVTCRHQHRNGGRTASGIMSGIIGPGSAVQTPDRMGEKRGAVTKRAAARCDRRCAHYGRERRMGRRSMDVQSPLLFGRCSATAIHRHRSATARRAAAAPTSPPPHAFRCSPLSNHVRGHALSMYVCAARE